MANYLGYQLKATGREIVPVGLFLGGRRYQRIAVFKHDFFAATSLFLSDQDIGASSGPPFSAKIVLKQARTADFMGLPLAWLGQLLCQHEIKMLRRLEGLEGVPKLLAKYGSTGMIYEYIEGKSLGEKPILPDNYFHELSELLSRIHQRRIAYIDMNKRGNLILGANGRPYLIDFQIAGYISPRALGLRTLSNALLRWLQHADFYHVNKHKRRLRKDLMTEQELAQSQHVSFWIRLHRKVTRPMTWVRRGLLGYFYRTNRLIVGDTSLISEESNPDRWTR